MSRFYYLAEQVELLEEFGDGWCRAKDSEGREWRMWRAQLRDAPMKPPPPRPPAPAPASIPTMNYGSVYERVTAELLKSAKRWTGDRWVYTLDCAAAHRISRYVAYWTNG